MLSYIMLYYLIGLGALQLRPALFDAHPPADPGGSAAAPGILSEAGRRGVEINEAKEDLKWNKILFYIILYCI